jgi:hypothetical protein
LRLHPESIAKQLIAAMVISLEVMVRILRCYRRFFAELARTAPQRLRNLVGAKGVPIVGPDLRESGPLRFEKEPFISLLLEIC